MKNEGNKKSVISVVMNDKQTLYQAYMPFLSGGGLFITTKYQYECGDAVFIRLKLPEETEPVPVACQVVWISFSENEATSGIGLQFLDRDDQVRNKIETFLAGILNSDKPTLTM